MPRIRTASPRRNGGRAPGRKDGVAVSGRSQPLTHRAVARAAARVLTGEQRQARLSITFVGRDTMRTMNRRWKSKRSATDVLAFALPGPNRLLTGDIYICPWMAARHARTLGIPLREELTRLVVHGVLHVLGDDHPEHGDRTGSPMWRKQERYLRALA